MNFIDKRLLESAVQIPKILIPTDIYDHVMWPSFSYVNRKLNETILDSKHIPLLMSSSDYMSDISQQDKRLRKKENNRIVKNMRRALKSDFLSTHNGFLLTRRITDSGKERFGLTVLLDYEQFNSDKQTLIQCSSTYDHDTVEKHCELLANAPFDFPYSSAFVDDPEKILIEPIISSIFHFKQIFSFENPIFGLYEGYLINTPQHHTLISNALHKLRTKASENDNPLFIVYDGIESFYAGYEHWNTLKSKNEKNISRYHPARFTMVELTNIHSENEHLTPCNILFSNVKSNEIIKSFRETDRIKVESVPSLDELSDAITKRFKKYRSMCYGLVNDNTFSLVTFRQPLSSLGIVNIEDTIASRIKAGKKDIKFNISKTEIEQNADNENQTAILMPPFNKATFFSDISASGPLRDYSYYTNTPVNQKFIFEARSIIQK